MSHKLEDTILTSNPHTDYQSEVTNASLTWGLKYSESQTIMMLPTFQSLLKASEGGSPSNMLERRDPARQEINREKQEARGDWLQQRRAET